MRRARCQTKRRHTGRCGRRRKRATYVADLKRQHAKLDLQLKIKAAALHGPVIAMHPDLWEKLGSKLPQSTRDLTHGHCAVILHESIPMTEYQFSPHWRPHVL